MPLPGGRGIDFCGVRKKTMAFWIKENPLYVMLALGTMLSAVWLIKNRDRLQIKTWGAVLLAILHTVAGVTSVKVFAFLEGDGPGAMSLFGGVFFLPLLYLLGAKLFRRKAADVCDCLTPVMIMTVMMARVNCILSGCCKGNSIPFITDRTVRWPTREAEIVFYLVLLIWLFIRNRKDRLIPGTAYPIYMAAYGAFRFVIEFFRVSDSPTIFHIAHLWAVLSFCIGIAVYGEVKRKKGSKRR